MNKQSCFNYCTKTKSGYIIYNTLYNALVRLNEEEYKCCCMEKECPKEMEQQFLEQGLWVDSKLDEKKHYLRYAYYLSKFNKTTANITLTTTMECNARCFYCYEHGGSKKEMDARTIEDVMAFIQKLDLSKGLNLNWFGGEPLLNYQCIDTISQKLNELEIPFCSYMITNGSLMSDEIIEKMAGPWNTKNIQITIDGTEKVYHSRKMYVDDNGDYYDLIWKIKKAADKGIHINIRINIDANNAEDACTLIRELEGYYKKCDTLTFYPAFLTGGTAVLSEKEKIELLKKMYNSLQDKRKITINNKLYSEPRINACMIQDKTSFVVDAEGYIYKCDHLVGHPERSFGKVKDYVPDTEYKAFPLREKCDACVFLPKCMGGCTSNFENGDDPCLIEKYMIMAYLELL